MYQIYVPGGVRGPDLLQRLGITELVAGAPGPFFTELLANGPDGKAGLLLEFTPNAKGEFHGRQWKACAPDLELNLPAGRFWWGFPPQGLHPDTLLRSPLLAGHMMTLGDGRKWRIPNMLLLPHSYIVDELTGDEAKEVLPRWNALYDRMTWAYGVLKAIVENDSTATAEEGRECRIYMAEVLATQYRVNLELCRRLKLFNDDNWFSIAKWTVDCLSLHHIEQELQKKSTVSTPPGSPPAGGNAA